MTCLSLLLLLALCFSQQSVTTYTQQGNAGPTEAALAQQRARAELHRQAATEINDLAAHIRSEADANTLVDRIGEEFAGILPPTWLTRGIRQQIAHAEYEAVSDSSRLIPEQRIVDIWNEYVREIGASDEALVTPAEVHNLRDADFAAGQFLWPRSRNIWTVTGIYALGPDGNLAEGCRAIETLRIFYDLDGMFDNLGAARGRVRKGTLASDELKKRQKNPPPQHKVVARLGIRVDNNPVRAAELHYVQQHGPFVLNGVIEKLFDELFPSLN